MNYTPNLTQTSLFELASSGDFLAITRWINQKLKPQGISARIAKETTGHLQVLVEFHHEPPVDRLIQFICHQLCQLNSPVIKKVKIVGRLSGSSSILWKYSVRINSHGKINFNKQSNLESKTDNLKFTTTFRYLILKISIVASFIIGIWVSYYSALVRNSISGKWIETAIEKVKVIEHRMVVNSQDPMITLMFGGDVNLSNQVSNLVKRDYKLPFAKIDEYRAADLSIVNLEDSLTGSTLNSTTQQEKSIIDPSYVKALTSGGVDLVNLANDYTLGYEQKSLLDTIETLEDAGIHSLGAGKTKKEARRPKIIEVKGQKIAYLNYYDTDIQATTSRISINSRNNDQIASDIQTLRKQVDWIIVNYHWGVELSEYPGDWQMTIARMTIDQGADLVVGHHSKVLQGAEIYQGRPIVYSLGNFIFGNTSNKENDYETAVLKVSLKPGKMKIEFLPVVVSKYQPQIAEGEKGKEILKHIAQISSVFHQPMRTPVDFDTINLGFNFVGIDSFSKERNSNTFSTPILPELPLKSSKDDLNSTNFSRYNSDEEASLNTNNSFSVPPILNPNEEQDPFIRQPFIKEPFIELPRL